MRQFCLELNQLIQTRDAIVWTDSDENSDFTGEGFDENLE